MSRSLTGLAALLALAWMPPAFAQHAESERADEVAPAELDSFRRARDRFKERMEELDGDTRSYMELRRGEERERLVGGYDTLIADLEVTENGQRELAVQRFERFLGRYPGAPYASHVRFRLADLYFEQATESWVEEADAYFARLNDPNTPIEDLEALGVGPKRDLAKPLDMYLRIIEDNLALPPADRYERLDGTYVMLGFVYNDVNNVQYDPMLARTAFADLVRVVPDSELADRSYLFLGNFAFGDNDFDLAIASYEAVYSKGDASKYYMEGLYQLAWAHYKLNAFDESLRLFTELLDISQQSRLDSGRESPFAPDARRFMAFSFADLGYDEDRDAHEIGQRYFSQIGPRAYEREVFEGLADVLIRYTRPEEAIATYELLQLDPRWVLEGSNPRHQIDLIGLYQTSLARDLAKAGDARLAFIQRYSEGSPWWEANRNDPESLEVALSFLESSLLDVAIEYRVRAQESGDPADFALAAAKYEEYLERFPISDDYYKQQWYLADSLKMGGRHADALAEFDSLTRSAGHHPYGDAALYSAMDVRYQAMLNLGHEPDRVPEPATIARTYETHGNTIDVYTLSADRTAFIEAADAVVSHTFGPTADPDLGDYQQEVGEKRPSLMYLIGQIMFYHGDYPAARERFEALISAFPRAIESNYAAGLLVDSYLAEGDLAQVRASTKRFTVNPPGPPTTVDPERFQGTLEGTTFKLALESAEAGNPLATAEEFLQFREEFPNSEFEADALYNAAFYYQQAGKVERSNALYEQFVADYPEDKRSKGLFFRIAANYEAAFDLQKAELFYDRLLQHPDATEAERADAQFNRSFLLIGLGRHEEAARGFEAYERDYPGQEDREDILWLAGEQWEAVDDDKAIAFYKRYLGKYPNESADHVIEAQSRLLSLYQRNGSKAWTIRRQNQAIIDTFDRFAQAKQPIGANGHRYAAQADFPRLEALFAEYSGDALTGNENKDSVILNETKPAELKGLEGQAKAFLAKYQNFEFNSGALLMQARAVLYLADLGLSIKCPPSLSEEDCWQYEDILQEQVFPQYYELEDVGIKRLTELVDAARARKRHSAYIDQALTELNRRRPGDFPDVKREIEGGSRSEIPVEVAPRRMDAGSGEGAQ